MHDQVVTSDVAPQHLKPNATSEPGKSTSVVSTLTNWLGGRSEGTPDNSESHQVGYLLTWGFAENWYT